MHHEELFNLAPTFVKDNLCLLAFGGSISYGVNTDESDVDLIGFCIPPKKFIYQENIITGFDTPLTFDMFTTQQVIDGTTHDISISSLARLAKLAYDGNPNALEVIFTLDEYVIQENKIGERVRDLSPLFLSKNAIYKCMGYARSEIGQVKKRKAKWGSCERVDIPRANLHEMYGYDTKSAAHSVRLLDNAMSMIVTHDVISDHNKMFIRSIREGNFTYEEIIEMVETKMRKVEDEAEKCSLTKAPDFDFIKKKLTEIFRDFYLTHD